ncbi:MAG: hypothetical protein IBX52_10220 [Bacterioplanes sp.]|nr:hypothetical protein [Bacterioplanes sp.]
MKRFFCLIIASCLPLTAFSTPWYRIEMMLVHYSDHANIERETWPLALDPMQTQPVDQAITQLDWWHIPPESLTIWNGFGAWPLPQATWPTPLSTLETLTLVDQANRINRRNDMQVIWHQAWIEPIQEEQHAIIHTLRIQPAGLPDLDVQGNIRFYLSRFLHIQTQLTVQHYQAMPSPIALNNRHYMSHEEQETTSLLQHPEARLSPLEYPIRVPLRAAQIDQSRRMRSGELHYIDHPMLGIVVRITPIENWQDIDRQP